jgi:hypothetical protein
MKPRPSTVSTALSARRPPPARPPARAGYSHGLRQDFAYRIASDFLSIGASALAAHRLYGQISPTMRISPASVGDRCGGIKFRRRVLTYAPEAGDGHLELAEGCPEWSWRCDVLSSGELSGGKISAVVRQYVRRRGGVRAAQGVSGSDQLILAASVRASGVGVPDAADRGCNSPRTRGGRIRGGARQARSCGPGILGEASR